MEKEWEELSSMKKIKIIMLIGSFSLQPAKYSMFLSVRQWFPSCMSDFFKNTIAGCYEAEFI